MLVLADADMKVVLVAEMLDPVDLAERLAVRSPWRCGDARCGRRRSCVPAGSAPIGTRPGGMRLIAGWPSRVAT